MAIFSIPALPQPYPLALELNPGWFNSNPPSFYMKNPATSLYKSGKKISMGDH